MIVLEEIARDSGRFERPTVIGLLKPAPIVGEDPWPDGDQIRYVGVPLELKRHTKKGKREKRKGKREAGWKSSVGGGEVRFPFPFSLFHPSQFHLGVITQTQLQHSPRAVAFDYGIPSDETVLHPV